MGDLGLNIAASGLAAQQAGMNTVAENLANASTPGYVSETANIVAEVGGDTLGVGDGALANSVTQVPAGFALVANQQAQGALSQASALQQVLTTAQSTFAEPSSQGLAAQLANFWASWSNISQNPSSPAAYTQVVDLAQGLASSLQQASTSLAQNQSNAESQLGSMVTNVNSLLSQVATLNGQIVASSGAGTTDNALIDQQNALVNQIASDIGASARTNSDGSIDLAVGGVNLVQGTYAASLGLTGTPGSFSLVDQADNLSIPATSGTGAGLLVAINQYLPSYQSQLDSVADALSSAVNTQLAAGQSTQGVSGALNPLFQGSGAAGITVNSAVLANPTLLAVSTTGQSNDGSNAQIISGLSSTAGGANQLYTTLIQGIGSQVQTTNNQVEAQTSVANVAQQNLQAIAGVNPDQQMVNMLNYQQAYEASAKVVSTISTMMDALLSAI